METKFEEIRLIPVAYTSKASTYCDTMKLVATAFLDALEALHWLHTNDIVHTD